MSNWKSTGAFFIFAAAYVYAILGSKEIPMVEATGYFLLIVTLFMMLRSDDLTQILKDLASSFKKD